MHTECWCIKFSNGSHYDHRMATVQVWQRCGEQEHIAPGVGGEVAFMPRIAPNPGAMFQQDIASLHTVHVFMRCLHNVDLFL